MGAMRVEPTGDPQGPHKEGSLVYQSWQFRPQGLPTPSMFLILASEGESLPHLAFRISVPRGTHSIEAARVLQGCCPRC